jgi:hypothetical protein
MSRSVRVPAHAVLEELVRAVKHTRASVAEEKERKDDVESKSVSSRSRRVHTGRCLVRRSHG